MAPKSSSAVLVANYDFTIDLLITVQKSRSDLSLSIVQYLIDTAPEKIGSSMLIYYFL